MRGDFSRDSFNPRKHFDGVKLQQGRVLLDAEFNEQTDIQNHLRQTALEDVIGACCIPASEPTSFEVSVLDSQTLRVNSGRIWVHGHLCDHQESINLNISAAENTNGEIIAGRYAVYLEVWERLITKVEDPALLETAVGVETATRTQTVCRPRLVQISPDATCEDLSAQPPLDGLLTTGSMQAFLQDEPPEDLCTIPPASEYFGVEHHLYRVEVHSGGDTENGSPPTFKWSRDNGSLVTEWLETNGHVLTVQSLGKDSIQNFDNVEWIELLGDDNDLTDKSGILVKVQSTKTTTQGQGEIELDDPPDAIPDPTILSHPKVRAWNQTSTNNANPDTGAIDITADTPIPIELGIHVQFSPGFYRAGDYWQIVARTFGPGSPGHIEWLTDDTNNPLALPPNGVQRYYCPLAIVNVPGGVFGEVLSDCRRTFQPLCEIEEEAAEGCCTVIVHPGESIQAAIDRLPPRGGCICIKSGDHQLSNPLLIQRKEKVTIHGEAGARILRSGIVPILTGIGIAADGAVLGDAEGTVIEILGIQFQIQPSRDIVQGMALFNFTNCIRVSIRDCWIIGLAQTGIAQDGVIITDSHSLEIERSNFRGLKGMVIARNVERIYIFSNTGVEDIPQRQDRAFFNSVAIFIESATRLSKEWVIRNNQITGFLEGVVLRSEADQALCQIDANQFFMRPPFQNEILPHGGWAFAGYLGVSGASFSKNLVVLRSSSQAGIWGMTSGLLIEKNKFIRLGNAESNVQRFSLGVFVQADIDNEFVPIEYGTIQGNFFQGPLDAIWTENSLHMHIENNVIEDTGPDDTHPRFGISILSSSHVAVTGNHIVRSERAIYLDGGRTNQVTANFVDRGTIGIHLNREVEPLVDNNVVRNLRDVGIIGVGLFGNVLVNQNKVIQCGHGDILLFEWALGVAMFGVAGEARITNCTVLDIGIAPEFGPTFHPTIPILCFGVLDSRVEGNLVSYTVGQPIPFNLGYALYCLGFPLPSPPTNEQPEYVFSSVILGNKFFAPGHPHQVLVEEFVSHEFTIRYDTVICSNNHFWHAAPSDQTLSTVSLKGDKNIVMGNRVRSDRDIVKSVDLNNKSSSLHGNMLRNGPTGEANVKPEAFADFNHIGII